jgi:2,5-diketo-D-gluconate reductase A
MNAVPWVTLNNGTKIPQLGFGVFQIDPAETEEATLTALRTGYRHIDTAEMYGNEKGVGAAVRASGIDRSEIFVTSKLNNNRHGRDAALRAFDATLEALGFEYLDLFLIHWPLPTVGDYVETWKAMEAIYNSGRCRAIGVSNFQIEHLRRLDAETAIVPAVNQIEVHPYLTQAELRAYDARHGIAARVGRTPAQVVLRWHIQRGDIVFPKSVTPERVRENFDIFDFVLSDDDIEAISGLNRDQRTGPDPDVFDYVPS